MKTWVLNKLTTDGSRVLGEFRFDEERQRVLYVPIGSLVPVGNDVFLQMWGSSYMLPNRKAFVTLNNPQNYFDKLPGRFRGLIFIS